MIETQTVTIPLTRPFGHNGAVYHSLTLREATVGDQLAVSRPEMGPGQVEVALIARLAGVPEEVIHAIRLTDYRAVQQVLTNFPSSPPGTSPGPSDGSPSPSGSL